MMRIVDRYMIKIDELRCRMISLTRVGGLLTIESRCRLKGGLQEIFAKRDAVMLIGSQNGEWGV